MVAQLKSVKMHKPNVSFDEYVDEPREFPAQVDLVLRVVGTVAQCITYAGSLFLLLIIL